MIVSASISRRVAFEIEGLTYNDAIRLANSVGLVCRVVKNNGTPLVTSRDYRIDRINLELTGTEPSRALGLYSFSGGTVEKAYMG